MTSNIGDLPSDILYLIFDKLKLSEITVVLNILAEKNGIFGYKLDIVELKKYLQDRQRLIVQIPSEHIKKEFKKTFEYNYFLEKFLKKQNNYSFKTIIIHSLTTKGYVKKIN